jgi:hypothetical protein
MRTVAQGKTETTPTNREQTFLLVAFTSVAVLLGTIGIYALISFLVVQRTEASTALRNCIEDRVIEFFAEITKGSVVRDTCIGENNIELIFLPLNLCE